MTTKPPRTSTKNPPLDKAAQLPTSRTALRIQMRAQRQALGVAAQREAATGFARNFSHCPLFRSSRHIAFYLANDGELDPAILLQRAWDMGKVCYLPVITPRQSLWFAAYADGDPLKVNRFGIPEPTRPGLTLVSARVLDLILTPLVTFDDRGHRLGMGGGFYDRTLSFLRHRHAWHKPRLVGVAHDWQRVAVLSAEPWDVPLDGVATDRQVYLFNNTRP
jgi:5-formyltetrahydrofolate cyclo-ligase